MSDAADNDKDLVFRTAFSRRSALGLGAWLGTACVLPAATRSFAQQPTASDFPDLIVTGAPKSSSWKPLRLGAGGYVTGVVARKNGTKVIRTDTHNAYVWRKEWVPLLSRHTLTHPEAVIELLRESYQAGRSDGLGAYAIAVGVNDTNRIYASIGGYVWSSKDKGLSVVRTNLPTMRMRANNGPQRYWGQKMAVDPANAGVVILGTEKDGLWETVDGGVRWGRIEGVPPSTDQDIPLLVAFDSTSGTTAGRTNVAYALSSGRGIYRRTRPGQGWELMAGSPAKAAHMICDQVGRLWVCGLTKDGLYRFEGGAWKAIPTKNIVVHSAAVNPDDAQHVWCTSTDNFHMQSRDGGATWGEVHFHRYPPPFGTRKFAGDIPWLARKDGSSGFAVGDVVFDPSKKNTLMMADGVGVFFGVLKPEPATLDWHSQSLGIEQLIPNFVLTPPGESPLVLCWDRPIFRITNPDQFPASYGPSSDGVTSPDLHHGWHASHAINNPKFVVALCNYWGQYHSGYSTDGGKTFTEFPAQPVQTLGGTIAVSDDPDKIIVFPSNNASPVRTTDRGKTWSEIVIPGVPVSGERGWGWAYYLKRFILAADTVNAGRLYAYNYGPEGAVAAAGIYESRDYGATWEHVYKGRPLGIPASWNARLVAVPGHAGQLFLCPGQEDGDTTSRAKRSFDGGRTWKRVPNISAVWALSFGKAKDGMAFPTIYTIGRVKGKFGVYRSTDEGESWVNYNHEDQPSIDRLVTVHGDMNVFGRAFLGFAGSGWAYTVRQ